MRMAGDFSSGLTVQVDWLGSHMALYSSREPGELSQWLCRDDSVL